jgi:superfamily II DNA/RNA helicase
MDEADRMVNLGFEADLLFILDKLPSETMAGEEDNEKMDVDMDGEPQDRKGRTRVTTLFSATMPPPVERLAKKYLKKPAVITIGEAGRAVDTVEQRVEFVSGDEKKKCVALGDVIMRFWIMLTVLFACAGSVCLRFSTATNLHHLSSSLSIKRRPPIWSPKIFPAAA